MVDLKLFHLHEFQAVALRKARGAGPFSLAIRLGRLPLADVELGRPLHLWQRLHVIGSRGKGQRTRIFHHPTADES